MPKFYIIVLVFGPTLSSYDEYLSCDRQYESSRSARVLDMLPSECDLTDKSYCYEKGKDYPDKAIRRFLKENLGLMKRMSSDVDSREVEREMRSASFNIYSNPVHDEEREQRRQVKSSSFTMNMMPPGENVFNGLHYNIKLGSGLAMVKNAKDEKVRDPDPVSLQTTNKNTRTSSSETFQTSTSQTTMIVTTSQSTSRSPPSSTPQPTTRQETTTNILPSTVTEQTYTNTVINTMETDTTFTSQEETTPPTLKEEDYYEEYVEDDTDISSEYIQQDDYIEEESINIDSHQNSDSEFDDLQKELTNLDPEDLESQLPEILQIFEEESEIQIQDASATEEAEEPVTEEAEQEPEIEYTGDPINACDVNESVQAPYWAKNTRNHTLALLNLYPFEQYIHMETCKSEFNEMLCRPGCRCEQQYRLHRLLAFDPSNECRGIFSDWFRFPSFCLCKCYTSAMQLKETMRNPKKQSFTPTQGKHHGPGPTHNRETSRLANHRMTKESKIFSPPVPNLPPVFPYEGRAMLFEELNNNHRGGKNIKALPRKMEVPYETQIFETDVDDPANIILEAMADEHMDNTVESDQTHYKKNHKQSRLLDDHFFYNQPILDFKLSDGTRGSLEQTPRKK